MEQTLVWGVIVLIIFGLKFFFKKNKKYRRNYSLGLKSAEDIQSLIKNKNYDKAEEIAKEQSINDITQIIDHLALSLNEKDLVAWNDLKKTDFSKLVLGVYYLHYAWIVRSHRMASEVSEDTADSFFNYLQKSENCFKTITKNSFYQPELASRNIRLQMSLGNDSLAIEYFNNVSKNNPDFIWPYIHYCEMIQPKWGGTIEGVILFYETLPNNFLIHSIIELKLILDAIIIKENYFEKYNTNINDFAYEKIIEIDKRLGTEEINSIHKYILYNYMDSVCDTIKTTSLSTKYSKLMDFNYTIYPYGLLN